jgi:hypothetical protein
MGSLSPVWHTATQEEANAQTRLTSATRDWESTSGHHSHAKSVRKVGELVESETSSSERALVASRAVTQHVGF